MDEQERIRKTCEQAERDKNLIINVLVWFVLLLWVPITLVKWLVH